MDRGPWLDEPGASLHVYPGQSHTSDSLSILLLSTEFLKTKLHLSESTLRMSGQSTSTGPIGVLHDPGTAVDRVENVSGTVLGHMTAFE